MIAILKTVNPATLNFAQAVLKEANIPFFLMDQNVSIIDGSIGIIPRRLMIGLRLFILNFRWLRLGSRQIKQGQVNGKKTR